MSHTIPPPPNPRRLITTHDAAGKSVWSDAYDEVMVPDEVKDKLRLFNAFTTTGMPADLNKEADLDTYRQHYPKMATLHSTGGTVLRIVDWAPSYRSSDHRSVTIDYGVILEGECGGYLGRRVDEADESWRHYRAAWHHAWMAQPELDKVGSGPMGLAGHPAYRGQWHGAWECDQSGSCLRQ